jgi:hypothetical protein
MAASSRGVALSGGLGRLHPESASEVHVLLYNSAIYRIAIFSPVCRRLRTFYGWLLQHETAPLDFFYIVIALLFLALIPGVVRTFGLAAGMYVLVSVLIPLSGNQLIGMGRYASVLFPVFMYAGTIGSSRVYEATLLVSAMCRTLFLMLLINWYQLY